jgi:hypothetical protein
MRNVGAGEAMRRELGISIGFAVALAFAIPPNLASAAEPQDWQEWSCRINTNSNDSGEATGGIRERVRVSIMQGRVVLIDGKGEREATDVRFTVDGVSFQAQPSGNYWWMSTRNGTTRVDVRGVRETGSGRCSLTRR